MALLILVVALVFFVVGLVSVAVFVIDVIRWHPRDKKEIIVPSNSGSLDDLPILVDELGTRFRNKESEVIKNDGTDNVGTPEPDEHNTSAFSVPWSES